MQALPLLIVGGAALWWYLDQETKSRQALPSGAPPKGPVNSGLARQLAQKYGPIFGAPVDLMMVIAKIESGYRPGVTNTSPNAMKRGGAWGMWQQTLETAKGHVNILKYHSNTNVREALKHWTGVGLSLLNPELNACLAAYHLGKLWKAYGSHGFEYVAGAYHQGTGPILTAIKTGKSPMETMGPNGRIYVTRALEERRKLVA